MFKIFMMTLWDFDGSLRDQDFHDDRLIFVFPYLVGYKALPLVKLSRVLSSSQKNYLPKNFEISKNTLGECKGKNQYNCHHSLLENAAIFSRPAFPSTHRMRWGSPPKMKNIFCILRQSKVQRTDLIQCYSNYS